VTKGRRKKGSEVEQFNFELDKMTKKDKKNVLELIKRVRRQEDELTIQQAYQDSFEEDLKKLKESNDVLSRKARRTSPRHMLVLLTLYLLQHPWKRKIKLSRTNLRKSLASL
jgi:hypothetical protein